MITLIIELILAISLIITIIASIKQGKQIDGLYRRFKSVEDNIRFLCEKSEKTYSHNAYTVANRAINKEFKLENRVDCIDARLTKLEEKENG